MAVFSAEHTARKRHRCDRCTRSIRPGERYVRWRMTPDDEVNDGTAWRGAATHPGTVCPESGRRT
jgi:hypothetical protein